MGGEEGAKRGPYARSLARREKISRAVLSIVDESGVEAVTTALVARRAHIPESSVLYHFPSKDHLLVAALRRVDEEAADSTGVDTADIRLDIALLRESGVDQHWVSQNRRQLDALVRTWAMDPEHPAAAFIADRNLRAVRVWRTIISRLQSDGLADPDLDPEAAAWQAIALLDGFTRFGLTHPDLAVGDLLADGILRLTGGRPR